MSAKGIGLLTVVALLFVAGPSNAGDQKWNLEIVWGYDFIENDADQDLEFTAFRIGRALGDRWAIEGSNRWFDGKGIGDARLFDLTAKYYLTGQRDIRPYVLAGPGRLEFDNSFASDSAWTFSAGVGLEVELPGRFYLRTEIRQFWIDFDGVDEDLNGEGSLGFGLRL